jgi:hypothetical protein
MRLLNVVLQTWYVSVEFINNDYKLLYNTRISYYDLKLDWYYI